MAAGGQHSFVFLCWHLYRAKYSPPVPPAKFLQPYPWFTHHRPALSSSSCQCSHPLVPHHLEVLHISCLPRAEICVTLLPDSWRCKSVLSSPLNQDLHPNHSDGSSPYPSTDTPVPQVRASICWHFRHQSATPGEWCGFRRGRAGLAPCCDRVPTSSLRRLTFW